MEKIKLALIGCGYLNDIVATAIQDGYLPEYELIAVLGRDYARAEEFAKRYGCKACADINELIALKPDFTAEAASVKAVREYSARLLNGGSNLVVLSIEEELERLGSGRAKADAIMTRMSKRIDAKWDENPAFYKKFSERIEEVLAQYKEKRISEADYLKRMTDILQDFRRGYTGVEYPESIRNRPHAQAFYGVVCEEAAEYCADGNKADILAMLALDIDIIIDKHSKVDWHDNLEVHNKIAQEIDDLLYLYQKRHDLHLPYEQIDKIIENVKTVALRRY